MLIIKNVLLSIIKLIHHISIPIISLNIVIDTIVRSSDICDIRSPNILRSMKYKIYK